MELWNKLKNILFSNKGLSTLGMANIFSSLLGGLFWFFIATILPADSYGELSYYIAIALIISIVASLGINNTLLVFVSKDPKITTTLFLIAIISILVSSIILFFVIQNIFVSLCVIGYGIFGLIISELLGRKLYRNYFKISIIPRVLAFVIPISLYFVIGIDGIMFGLAASYLIYIYNLIVTLKHGKINFSIIKTYKGFMLNNYGYELSRIFTTQLDKLIIFPLFGLMTLGNYSLAVQFIAVGIILPGTVYQYLLSQESKTKSFTNLKLTTILVSVLLTILTIVLAPIILPILFPHFVDVVQLVQIMILSLIPQTINLMYITKFLTNGKSRIVLIGSGIFLTAQIGGIVILGNMMGIFGIALGFILGHISEFIFFTIANQYIKHKK